MTVIIDYGVGNLFSLKSSLSYIGDEATVSGDPEAIKAADRIILPGVGAFSDAAAKLAEHGLDKLIISEAENGKPLLGICLGMQLLFNCSYEYGLTQGLGLVSGEVKSIAPIIPTGYKVPHIGWNSLKLTEKGKASPIFKYISEGDFVYFVHSFAATNCDESLIASTEYGAELTAAVSCKNVYGTQFHPEKSGTIGLKILKAFCEL
ncbi:MAG: imidazole glycerol phosphate synthase subunit HisH [Oscillospiraceae bacterium]